MKASETCKEVRPLIDDLVDGSLDDARARAVRAHLRMCAACEARAEATRALISAAAHLPRVDAPIDLWQGIAARLDDEEERRGRPSRLFWLWHAWRRTLFAGGGALAAAALILVVWTTGGRRPLAEAFATLPRPPVSAADLYEQAVREVSRAEKDYTAAIDELRQVASDERKHWAPEAARAFDANLAVIDAAIERQAAAFRGAPEDPAAADELHAMYRKKIDFLQEAIVRGQL